MSEIEELKDEIRKLREEIATLRTMGVTHYHHHSAPNLPYYAPYYAPPLQPYFVPSYTPVWCGPGNGGFGQSNIAIGQSAT